MYKLILYIKDLPFSDELGALISILLFMLIGILTYYFVYSLLLPMLARGLTRFFPAISEIEPSHLSAFDKSIAHLAVAMVWITQEDFFIGQLEVLKSGSYLLSHIYLYLVMGFIFSSMINIFGDIYNRYRFSRDVPIRGLTQILNLLTFIITSILIISVLVGKTPLYLLSGLGALTAVLLLVFKDTILGFVASIQIAANRMISIGDWIEVKQYGADGEVLEIGLNTVKVQNWDKTTTMIPTYALISDSFKNWRGMEVSGGRRIKRAIYLDIKSVKAVSSEEKSALSLQFNEFLFQPQTNTNIGLYREYCEAHLKSHPMINQNMTCMVRQLPPSELGIPLEIYCFSREKQWVTYEHIQAGIIESMLVLMKQFDLTPYQLPTKLG